MEKRWQQVRSECRGGVEVREWGVNQFGAGVGLVQCIGWNGLDGVSCAEQAEQVGWSDKGGVTAMSLVEKCGWSEREV